MLTFFVGMVAFAVDTSWIVMTQSELQNSSDSAALAGAQQLVKSYPLYALPGQSTSNKISLADSAAANARTVAKTYGSANGAGGLSTLAYLDADLEVGFTDAKGHFTAYSAGGNYPNTVRAKSRRDSTANNSLSLFFGSVIGTSTVPLSAPATATLYTATVNSFTYPSTGNAAILPFTYDVNHWKTFVDTGNDPDGNTTYGLNKSPQLQVYPSIKNTGNFGQLSLNDGNVGNSVMKTWLQDGVNSSDIGALIQHGLLPLSSHNPNAWDWQGSTGFQSSLIQSANTYVGKTFWLPLFKPVDSNSATYTPGVGKGSNFSYNIVAFVPVQIVQSQNSNRQVVLQPADVIDSSAAFDVGSVTPAGTSTTTYFSSVLAPRLSN